MKKSILLLVLLAACHLIYAQSFINIGSTKEDVKVIQGEPKGIESYEAIGEEVWRYGESGFASVTFKNGKVKGFNNHDNVLRIGDISKTKQTSEKTMSKEEFWKKANGEATYIPKEKDAYESDSGELYGSSSQDIKSFSPEYQKMAKDKGLDPYETNEYDLQQMQKEYDNERLIEYGLIVLGVVLFGLLIIKLLKKTTKSNISE